MKIFTQKFKRDSLLSLLLMLCSFVAVAQTTLVRGVVIDSNGDPVIGASVTLSNDGSIGTMTDVEGYYSISVPASSSAISISYIGMQDQTIEINGRQIIDIEMVNSTEVLEEIIIVGYGQQKKASVVGAITQTSGTVLEKTGGVTNLGSALTGNLPGVITTSSTGMPGEEDPQIVIRGASSWNSSDPLVLVDGVERPMSDVEINSVESISVLKDASATAVYGVKGANGVILITTKRGEVGEAKIGVTASATMKTPSFLPTKYDSYDALMLRNVAIEHELALSPDSWAYITPQSTIENYRNQTSIEQMERYPNVDWQSEIFKDFTMSYNAGINISGGTEKVKYYVAADYIHEGDIFEVWDNGRGYESGYAYDRLNVRSNLDFTITPTTKLSVNLSGSNGDKKSPWANNASDYWAIAQQWAAVYNIAPDVFFPKYSDGTWGYYPLASNITNSAARLSMNGVMKINTSRINTDFVLTQDLSVITKGLSARGMVAWDNVFVEYQRGIDDGYNNSTTAQYKWIDPATGEAYFANAYDAHNNFDFAQTTSWVTGAGTMANGSTQRNLNYQVQLNWAREYGRHSLSAMGLFSRQERATGSQIPNYREDWAFRTTYNYDGRYFLEYNGAYNGSEKFSSENRFAFFNSGAIGWMISEENFIKDNIDFLDMLKLRLSYGEIGDDNISSRWLYMTQWAYGGASSLDVNQGTSPYSWYTESSIGNEAVHWETVAKANFGVDFSIFDGLFAGNFDLFEDNRRDILLDGDLRSVPSYYGATAPTANLGKVETKGYEFELRFNKVIKKGLRVWANFSVTHAETLVIEKDDADLLPDYQKAAGYAMGQNKDYLDNGFCSNYDQIFGSPQFDTNDLQKLPGDYYITDYNADGVIDSNDEIPVGYSGTPQNTYNATFGVNWKGFSAYAQFYGVNNVSRWVGLSSFTNLTNNVYDQGVWWSKNEANADVTVPRWTSTESSYNSATQDTYDGSYIRLKNLEISYSFDDSIARKVGMRDLRIFVNGNNLWVWSRMPDDRESNFAGAGNNGAYPTMKRYNLGVKFTL